MTQFKLILVLLQHLVLAPGMGQHVGNAQKALSPTLKMLLVSLLLASTMLTPSSVPGA